MFRIRLFGSVVFLLVTQASGQAAGRPAAKPFSLAQVWTLNATYADPQHGVTFRYPEVWQATTQFAYHPPRLSQSEEAKPIAGFGYSEGGFPRSSAVGPYTATNLEGVGIVYSAVPAASVDGCEALAATISETPKHTEVSFGGRSFSAYGTEGIGMSQSISGTLYAAYLGSTCYLFETDVAVVSPGVADDIQALTPAQLESIQGHLLEIMKSVQIDGKVR